jgi:AraC-like DNA-binding protein
MPGSGTSTFIDPDDYQASLDRVPLDLLLVTSRGEFKAGVTSARLNHLYLLRSEEDLPRIAYVSLSPALVFAGFPTGSSPPIVWGGVELHPGEIVLHSRAERFHQRTAGPCNWGLIGLAAAEFEQYSETLTGKMLTAPAAGRILRPATRNSARLLRLFTQACRLAETRPRILGHPEVARGLEQGIIHALMTCLRSTRVKCSGPAKQHNQRILIRFEEVLAKRLGGPLRMSELCALTGVNERTLRSCCAEFLGISPSRYVLLRRLKQARTALRNADRATVSVGKIARACGFTELGRFARAYQTVFGETPLTTLRRMPGSGPRSPIFTDPA